MKGMLLRALRAAVHSSPPHPGDLASTATAQRFSLSWRTHLELRTLTLSRVGKAGPDVFFRELGKVRQDLRNRHARGQVGRCGKTTWSLRWRTAISVHNELTRNALVIS